MPLVYFGLERQGVYCAWVFFTMQLAHIQLTRSTGMHTHSQDIEIAELQRRLRAERGVRKACEKWLKAELRSRVSASRGSCSWYSFTHV